MSEPELIYADELSGWLYDSVLLHDTFVLSQPYYAFTFNRYFYRRNGRPVRNEDRLRVERVRYESPLLVETVITTAVALKGLLTTYEWIRDRPERRRIVVAEADKIEEEARKARIDRKLAQRELARVERQELEEAGGSLRSELLDAAPGFIENPEALRFAERGAARLSASPFDVESVEVLPVRDRRR